MRPITAPLVSSMDLGIPFFAVEALSYLCVLKAEMLIEHKDEMAEICKRAAQAVGG